MIIPSGPLREGLECLKEVQIVVINGKIDKDFETKILSINNKIEFTLIINQKILMNLKMLDSWPLQVLETQVIFLICLKKMD